MRAAVVKIGIWRLWTRNVHPEDGWIGDHRILPVGGVEDFV